MRSDFAALRRVCSTISLYCDLRDPALFLAEGLVFRSTTLHTALLPKVAPRGVWRVRVPRPDMHHALSVHVACLPCPATVRIGALYSAVGLLRICRQWLMGGDNRCAAPNQYKGFRSLGLHPQCLVHPETSASLDMDVYAAAPRYHPSALAKPTRRTASARKPESTAAVGCPPALSSRSCTHAARL